MLFIIYLSVVFLLQFDLKTLKVAQTVNGVIS